MRLSVLANEAISPDPVISGLASDSRKVENGFLFAALPGEHVDGADYIGQAEQNGAAAVLARPGVSSRVPQILDEEPHRRLSELAARFYPAQPPLIAGITGTNGKTSTAQFTEQLWRLLNLKSGSIGTLGARSENFERQLGFTTPEPISLHRTLNEMGDVTHLAMEVSSHGLAQYRADGVRFSIAAFTNLTQDHLDFHASFTEYQQAKQRLFGELLQEDGIAVINKDGAKADEMLTVAKARGIRTITTGKQGEILHLAAMSPRPEGLSVQVNYEGQSWDLTLPLIGGFQAENALLAAGVVFGSGAAFEEIAPLLEQLSGVPGRMQYAASCNGGAVYVDYAHTPDAISTAIAAARPHTSGRLIVVIGAGGDRDKDKRPLMGAAADDNTDAVIVTDDNPRSEDPASIRNEIMAGAANAMEIGDRHEAIATGVGMLEHGDVLLILGKGHETGQQVGDKIFAFNDIEVAKAEALARNRELG